MASNAWTQLAGIVGWQRHRLISAGFLPGFPTLTRTFRAAGIETILALPKEAETDNLAPLWGWHSGRCRILSTNEGKERA